MNIPDQISPEELQLLAEQSSTKGITPVEAADLLQIAKQKINELERIYKELESCNTVGVSHDRWMFFLRGRQAINVAIRNFKRCIAI